MPEGHYFAWSGQNTRDGVAYGACQPYHYCKSAKEREVQIKKYLAGAQKRYTK